MWTFGGFYIGYLRDMWRIPTYVAECNFDKPFIKFSREQMEYRQHPPGFFTSVSCTHSPNPTLIDPPLPSPLASSACVWVRCDS